MSTATEHEYPQCAKRLAGADMHPKCNDPSKGYFLRPVRPTECLRCLGLEPTPTSATTPESLPPPKPATPPPSSKPCESAESSESSEPPAPPGLVRRAISYAEALAQWTAAGRPERSDKEVEHIFAHFCKPCRWYHHRRHICRGCGCRVADKGFAIINKIKMATEHCPRNLW